MPDLLIPSAQLSDVGKSQVLLIKPLSKITPWQNRQALARAGKNRQAVARAGKNRQEPARTGKNRQEPASSGKKRQDRGVGTRSREPGDGNRET